MGFSMIDPADLKALIERLPGPGFIGIKRSSHGDARLNEVGGVRLALEYSRNRIAAALANDHDILRALPF